MNKIFTLLLMTFLTTCFFSEFSNAQDTVLTAAQVNKLFTERTFLVTEAKMDQKTRQFPSYRVRASNTGAIQVVTKDVRPQPRIWSVKEDGSFCYSMKLSRNSKGKNCGLIVPTGGGVYKMYRIKGKYTPNRKIVGGKGSTHVFTFSDFK